MVENLLLELFVFVGQSIGVCRFTPNDEEYNGRSNAAGDKDKICGHGLVLENVSLCKFKSFHWCWDYEGSDKMASSIKKEGGRLCGFLTESVIFAL